MKSILDILDDMEVEYFILCGCEDAPCCGCNK